MSQEYIEITEKNLQDAITTACQKLSVTSDRLDYEVIDPGKSGFLGIGARPAKIRARRKEAAEATQAILDKVMDNAEKKVQKKAKAADVKPTDRKPAADNKPLEKKAAENKSVPQKAAEKKTVEKQPEVKKPAEDKSVERKPQEKKQKSADRKKSEGRASGKKYENRSGKNSRSDSRREKNSGSSYKPEIASAETVAAAEAAAENAAKKKTSRPLVLTENQVKTVEKKSEDFLKDVFAAMKMDVQITQSYDEQTGVLNISLEGDDMAVLIGKRGQTLDSLQYLVTLVVNRDKDFEGYIHVKADTENYRERRKKTLENLAKNMAAKVKRTGKPFTFEPMNPYERRIIHSALQNDRYVTTYSEGEEPYRKVVVILKKDPGEDFAKRDRRGGRGDRRGRDRRGGRNGYDRSGRSDKKRYSRAPETSLEKAEALQSDSEALQAAEAASERAEAIIESASEPEKNTQE